MRPLWACDICRMLCSEEPRIEDNKQVCPECAGKFKHGADVLKNLGAQMNSSETTKTQPADIIVTVATPTGRGKSAIAEAIAIILRQHLPAASIRLVDDTAVAYKFRNLEDRLTAINKTAPVITVKTFTISKKPLRKDNSNE